MRMWSCEDRAAPFVEVFQRTATRAGYDVRLIAPQVEAPPAFQQLKKYYRHLSPNPERFELASFRRWFEIAAHVAPSDRFVLADSDLVVFAGWNTLPAKVREHEGVIGSIGITGGVSEEGINGGFSLWTGRLLREFCDYMVTSYERDGDRLALAHVAQKTAGNPRAAISDMTLLYRWVRDAGVCFFNTNLLIRDAVGQAHYIDHNFNMREAFGVRFGMTLGRKKVLWRDGRAELVTHDGEFIVADLLHLTGRCKMMAPDIEQRNPLRLTIKSAYLFGGRTGRGILTTLASGWSSGPA